VIFLDLLPSLLPSVSNGLSDHDSQLVIIHDIALCSPINYIRKRKIDKFSLANLNFNLSFEIWNDVFEGTYVSIMFNSFLNTFLRHVYANFSLSPVMS
jgi:hypothetical protein